MSSSSITVKLEDVLDVKTKRSFNIINLNENDDIETTIKKLLNGKKLTIQSIKYSDETSSPTLIDNIKPFIEPNSQGFIPNIDYVCFFEHEKELDIQQILFLYFIKYKYGDKLLFLAFDNNNLNVKKSNIDDILSNLENKKRAEEFLKHLKLTNDLIYNIMTNIKTVLNHDNFEECKSAYDELMHYSKGECLSTFIDIEKTLTSVFQYKNPYSFVEKKEIKRSILLYQKGKDTEYLDLSLLRQYMNFICMYKIFKNRIQPLDRFTLIKIFDKKTIVDVNTLLKESEKDRNTLDNILIYKIKSSLHTINLAFLPFVIELFKDEKFTLEKPEEFIKSIVKTLNGFQINKTFLDNTEKCEELKKDQLFEFIKHNILQYFNIMNLNDEFNPSTREWYRSNQAIRNYNWIYFPHDLSNTIENEALMSRIDIARNKAFDFNVIEVFGEGGNDVAYENKLLKFLKFNLQDILENECIDLENGLKNRIIIEEKQLLKLLGFYLINRYTSQFSTFVQETQDKIIQSSDLNIKRSIYNIFNNTNQITDKINDYTQLYELFIQVYAHEIQTNKKTNTIDAKTLETLDTKVNEIVLPNATKVDISKASASFKKIKPKSSNQNDIAKGVPVESLIYPHINQSQQPPLHQDGIVVGTPVSKKNNEASIYPHTGGAPLNDTEKRILKAIMKMFTMYFGNLDSAFVYVNNFYKKMCLFENDIEKRVNMMSKIMWNLMTRYAQYSEKLHIMLLITDIINDEDTVRYEFEVEALLDDIYKKQNTRIPSIQDYFDIIATNIDIKLYENNNVTILPQTPSQEKEPSTSFYESTFDFFQNVFPEVKNPYHVQKIMHMVCLNMANDREIKIGDYNRFIFIQRANKIEHQIDQNKINQEDYKILLTKISENCEIIYEKHEKDFNKRILKIKELIPSYFYSIKDKTISTSNDFNELTQKMMEVKSIDNLYVCEQLLKIMYSFLHDKYPNLALFDLRYDKTLNEYSSSNSSMTILCSLYNAETDKETKKSLDKVFKTLLEYKELYLKSTNFNIQNKKTAQEFVSQNVVITKLLFEDCQKPNSNKEKKKAQKELNEKGDTINKLFTAISIPDSSMQILRKLILTIKDKPEIVVFCKILAKIRKHIHDNLINQNEFDVFTKSLLGEDTKATIKFIKQILETPTIPKLPKNFDEIVLINNHTNDEFDLINVYYKFYAERYKKLESELKENIDIKGGDFTKLILQNSGLDTILKKYPYMTRIFGQTYPDNLIYLTKNHETLNHIFKRFPWWGLKQKIMNTVDLYNEDVIKGFNGIIIKSEAWKIVRIKAKKQCGQQGQNQCIDSNPILTSQENSTVASTTQASIPTTPQQGTTISQQGTTLPQQSTTLPQQSTTLPQQGVTLSQGPTMLPMSITSQGSMGISYKQSNISDAKKLKNMTKRTEKFLNKIQEFYQMLKKSQTNAVEGFDKKMSLEGQGGQKGGASGKDVPKKLTIIDIVNSLQNPGDANKNAMRKLYTNRYTDFVEFMLHKFNTNFKMNQQFFLSTNKDIIQYFEKMKEYVEKKEDVSDTQINVSELNRIANELKGKVSNEGSTSKSDIDTQLEIIKNTLRKDDHKAGNTLIESLEHIKSLIGKVHADDEKKIRFTITIDKMLDRLNTIAKPDLLYQASKTYIEQYTSMIDDIDKANSGFAEIVRDILQKTENVFLFIDAKPVLDPKQARNLTDLLDESIREIGNKNNKLKSYYTLNYSIMDLISDPQFMVMYLIKGLRILFAYVSLFLATRIFSPIYESAVYDNQGNPPSLSIFTGIYLALDLAFNAFLFVLLYLLRIIFGGADDSFVVDKYLFKKYVTDYVISTLFLLAMANLIATVITNKKYFKYKYEGLRAIRAFEQIMFMMAIVVYLFPFFWVL